MRSSPLLACTTVLIDFPTLATDHLMPAPDRADGPAPMLLMPPDKTFLLGVSLDGKPLF
jgi:hypothetical protein